jgi:hypothetical protein
MAKILFFGYGVFSNTERLRQILGREPEGGESAIIGGYDLGVQKLESIPGRAKKILESVYGKTFRAYTLKKGHGLVQGKLWLLTEEDFKKIKEWSFVNESEDPWREVVETYATTSKGEKVPVLTEKILESQRIDEFVEGLNYETELNANLQRELELQRLRELDRSYIMNETNRIREQLVKM